MAFFDFRRLLPRQPRGDHQRNGQCNLHERTKMARQSVEPRRRPAKLLHACKRELDQVAISNLPGVFSRPWKSPTALGKVAWICFRARALRSHEAA
jgi:hypothetical protein